MMVDFIDSINSFYNIDHWTEVYLLNECTQNWPEVRIASLYGDFLRALFKNNNHSTQNLALLCEQAVFIECMVTWEQVCWLGSPVGPDQGYVSEIEILRPPVSESPVVLAKLQTPGRLPTLEESDYPWADSGTYILPRKSLSH